MSTGECARHLDEDSASAPAPTPEQRSFIERDPFSHALLAAGPGTGKTWVLERRSKYLVEAGVEADRIALLTLTRSMAASLEERIDHGDASTVHSFALCHLNRLGEVWDKNICTPWEQRHLVVEDLKLGHNMAFPDSNCSVRQVSGFLDRMQSGFSKDQVEPPDLAPVEQRLLQILRGQQTLFNHALLSELVYDLSRLLETGIPMTHAPTHVLVDEYQDLTAGELRLIQLIAEKHGSWVNACGDDRQSIYGFRCADPLALHRFAGAYEITGGDSLFRSRRLPRLHCDLANKIAEAMPAIDGLDRPPLRPWTDDGSAGVVSITQARSEKAEYESIGRRIAELRDRGERTEDVVVVAATAHDAVLAGLRRYAEPLAGVTFESGRPHRPDPSSAALTVHAVAQLKENSANQMAWRLLVHLRTGLGTVRMERILKSEGATYEARVRRIAESDSATQSVVDAVDLIRSTPLDADDPSALRSLVENVASLVGLEIDKAGIGELIPETDPASQVSDEEERVDNTDETDASDAVVVHTVHGVKGLEAPIVFVCGAVTEAFAGRGGAADGLRRLFVALTRASKELHVSAPRSVRGTAFGRKLGVDYVGLADAITNAAGVLGIDLESA